MRTGRFAVTLILVCMFFSINSSSAPRFEFQAASNPSETGYIRVQPAAGTTSPPGLAIFGFTGSNGVLISETGEPSSLPVQSGRIFAEMNGSVSSGIAFANAGSTSATITFYFTNQNGVDFGSGSTTVAAGQQISGFLNAAPFNLATTLDGTFTFASSVPVSVSAFHVLINSRSETVITTLPVSPLGSGFGGDTVLLPDPVSHGNWETQIVLVNPGNTKLAGTLEYMNQGSTSGVTEGIRVSINGVSSSSFKYSIPAHSAVQFITQTSRATTDLGSVQISPARGEEAPSAFAIFSYQNNGVTVSASASTALSGGLTFLSYIEYSGVPGAVGSVQSALTIFNPSRSRTTVQVTATTLAGASTGLSSTLQIPAGGEVSRTVTQLFPSLPSGFQGVVRAVASEAVNIIALRGKYNSRGDLLMAATQPWNESTARVGQEMDVPLVFQGGGYSTELLLLSTGSNNTGTLSLVSNSGGVLSGVQLVPSP